MTECAALADSSPGWSQIFLSTVSAARTDSLLLSAAETESDWRNA